MMPVGYASAGAQPLPTGLIRNPDKQFIDT